MLYQNNPLLHQNNNSFNNNFFNAQQGFLNNSTINSSNKTHNQVITGILSSQVSSGTGVGVPNVNNFFNTQSSQVQVVNHSQSPNNKNLYIGGSGSTGGNIVGINNFNQLNSNNNNSQQFINPQQIVQNSNIPQTNLSPRVNNLPGTNINAMSNSTNQSQSNIHNITLNSTRINNMSVSGNQINHSNNSSTLNPSNYFYGNNIQNPNNLINNGKIPIHNKNSLSPIQSFNSGFAQPYSIIPGNNSSLIPQTQNNQLIINSTTQYNNNNQLLNSGGFTSMTSNKNNSNISNNKTEISNSEESKTYQLNICGNNSNQQKLGDKIQSFSTASKQNNKGNSISISNNKNGKENNGLVGEKLIKRNKNKSIKKNNTIFNLLSTTTGICEASTQTDLTINDISRLEDIKRSHLSLVLQNGSKNKNPKELTFINELLYPFNSVNSDDFNNTKDNYFKKKIHHKTHYSTLSNPNNIKISNENISNQLEKKKIRHKSKPTGGDIKIFNSVVVNNNNNEGSKKYYKNFVQSESTSLNTPYGKEIYSSKVINLFTENKKKSKIQPDKECKDEENSNDEKSENHGLDMCEMINHLRGKDRKEKDTKDLNSIDKSVSGFSNNSFQKNSAIGLTGTFTINNNKLQVNNQKNQLYKDKDDLDEQSNFTTSLLKNANKSQNVMNVSQGIGISKSNSISKEKVTSKANNLKINSSLINSSLGSSSNQNYFNNDNSKEEESNISQSNKSNRNASIKKGIENNNKKPGNLHNHNHHQARLHKKVKKEEDQKSKQKLTNLSNSNHKKMNLQQSKINDLELNEKEEKKDDSLSREKKDSTALTLSQKQIKLQKKKYDPFNIFLEEFKLQNPDIDENEIEKKAKANWTQLDKDTRKIYNIHADREKKLLKQRKKLETRNSNTNEQIKSYEKSCDEDKGNNISKVKEKD